jgi:hypothetical protein
MSINIGFRNNSYSPDDFTPQESKLSVNTFHNSNAILLNIDSDASSNCVVNFRNIYSCGIINNKYTVYDINNRSAIMELSSNIVINSNLFVRNLIYTASNVTAFNSNVNCFLQHANDKVRVYDTDKNVAFEVNSENTSIKNVKVGNTLYVDTIRTNNGSTVEIVNPNIVGLVIQSFNTEQALTVKNVLGQYYSTPTVLVNRYDNLMNIMQLGTCNIYRPGIVNQFVVDRKGRVGIGPMPPDASLNIAQIEDNPYIIKYKGSNDGDIFNVMARGNLGIGTSEPKALIHIARGDDLRDSFTRKDPMIKMDMQYNGLSNISYASNIQTILNKNNLAGVFDFDIDIVRVEGDENINTSNYYNEFYIGNTELQERFWNSTYDTSNVKLRIATDNIQYVRGLNTNIYRSENVIYFSCNLYGYERPSAYSYSAYDTRSYVFNVTSSTHTSNFIRNHIYNYSVLLMSKDTYNYSGYNAIAGDPRNNANRFVNVPLYYSNLNGIMQSIFSQNTTSNFIHNIYFNINVLLEDVSHKVDYKLATAMQVYEPPYYLYLTSNRDFKAGISGYGCLSLGTLDMSSNKYVLFADGTSYLRKAEINEIYSSNMNINFNGINVSNINAVHCNSNVAVNAYIQNASISNITVVNQFCSNLQTSNLNIIGVNASYLKMNASFINYNTRFSVTNSVSDALIDNSSLVKFSAHRGLSSGNAHFKNYRGLAITNDNNLVGKSIYERVNPSIAIIGYDDSIPYINLARASSEYFVRINNRDYGITGNTTDVFEICCDNLTGDTSRINFYNNLSEQTAQPSFINHIKNFNVLTLGELPNVCIKCTIDTTLQAGTNEPSLSAITNGTNKIALGFPYGINTYGLNNWPRYFDNVICKNSKYAPYMLNVFGNMGVFSINGKTMMTLKVDEGLQRNALNENVLMTVNGDIYADGDIDCVKLNEYSDSNIKTDLKIIDNALEKVNAITGYTFTNTLTSDRQAGLIAQEVQQVLPEVVSKNKDGIHSIAYGNVMGLLVESIKDLTKKMENIERRLDALERVHN